MLNSDQNPKVTIEDLLRLKRAERPSPEFWSKFEQELRQKQLTALVKKRRWWHEMSLLVKQRFYVPAGVTAVLAITLAGVRYSTPAQIGQIEGTTSKIAATEFAIEMPAPTVVAQMEPISADNYKESITPVSQPIDMATNVQPRVSNLNSSTVQYTSLASMPGESETPSARSIAANLARLEQSEPELLNAVMGSRLSASARVQPAAIVQTDLSGLTENSGKKYRLIARYADRSLSPEPVAPALVRERLARRLGEDLGDSISRIGVVGSHVSLKF